MKRYHNMYMSRVVSTEIFFFLNLNHSMKLWSCAYGDVFPTE